MCPGKQREAHSKQKSGSIQDVRGNVQAFERHGVMTVKIRIGKHSGCARKCSDFLEAWCDDLESDASPVVLLVTILDLWGALVLQAQRKEVSKTRTRAHNG